MQENKKKSQSKIVQNSSGKSQLTCDKFTNNKNSKNIQNNKTNS